MTDAPDGLTEGEPERGSRRSSRVGDGGSPVGSTLSIVLAVVAVIAGFLILLAITDDDDGQASGSGTEDTGSVPGSVVGNEDLTSTSVGVTTTQPEVRTGATVVVANASGVAGSAAAMSNALEGAGYTTGEPGNSTGERLDRSVVYFAAGDTAAEAVARTVARDMGGIAVEEMPTPPPFDGDLGGATVLVMVGTDTAGKSLADLQATAVTAPEPAAATTTTTTG